VLFGGPVVGGGFAGRLVEVLGRKLVLFVRGTCVGRIGLINGRPFRRVVGCGCSLCWSPVLPELGMDQIEKPCRTGRIRFIVGYVYDESMTYTSTIGMFC
jgi:hypothetical protein